MDPDFALRWPRELFIGEAERLMERASSSISALDTAIEMLVEEAFESSILSDHIKDGSLPAEFELGRTLLPGGDPVVQLLAALVERVEELPDGSSQRPYWTERLRGHSDDGLLGVDSAKSRFVEIVAEFDSRGYLNHRWPAACVDDDNGLTVDRSAALEDLIGIADLWPLRSSRDDWTEDTFFDLVEIFHDVVARPTDRSLHSYGGCGYHWSGYVTTPARRLYRWKVNLLLGKSELPYELADEGEDEGRLIQAPPDARRELTREVLSRSNDGTRDEIHHAIALFRRRGASVQVKRSALVALAGVLEARRDLLKRQLLSKDEAALFRIANQFAIRHQNLSQQTDYDPAFLDWMFWWYLATVELSDQLLSRDSDIPADDEWSDPRPE